MSDGAEQIQKAQIELAKFQQRWNQQIQPLIDQNPQIPAQFVIDIAKILTEQLGTPLFELSKVSATGRVSSLAAKFLGIGVGGGVTIAAGVTDQVEAAASAAADTLLFLLGQINAVVIEATQALAVNGKRATVGIVTSGPDRLDQIVIRAFNAAASAWQQLTQIQAVADTSLLFRFAESQIDAAIAAGNALAELGRVLAAAGRLVYNTVVGFGSMVSLLAKVAVVGGVAYVGYQFFKPQQPAPTPNPRRRRRHPRARRPYGYLR